MKATRIFTASGDSLLVEYGGTENCKLDRCWDSEEISEVDVEINEYDNLCCDICGNEFIRTYNEELNEFAATTENLIDDL